MIFEDANEITHCYSIDIIFIYMHRFGCTSVYSKLGFARVTTDVHLNQIACRSMRLFTRAQFPLDLYVNQSRMTVESARNNFSFNWETINFDQVSAKGSTLLMSCKSGNTVIYEALLQQQQTVYRGRFPSIGLSLNPGSHDGQVQTSRVLSASRAYVSFDYVSVLPAFPFGRYTAPGRCFRKKSARSIVRKQLFF